MTDEPTFADERWVRIMADTAAEGVWDCRGTSGCADELPIPADLVERLLRWQVWYDRSEADEGGFDPAFDLDAFSAEGLAIAHAIKAALPDWTVLYFDEARCQQARAARWDERGVYRGEPPRLTFEYEITLPESTPVP